MIALIIVCLALAIAYLFTEWLWPKWPPLTKLAAAVPFSLIPLGWVLFALYITNQPVLNNAITATVVLAGLFCISCYFLWPNINLSLHELSFTDIIFITVLIIFSSFLMVNSFDLSNNTLVIGAHEWSDFGAHIPLLRSFSLGYNAPPEFPLFPNEPIRYHFMFYFLAGLFEHFGENLALSLNLLSALGFFSFGAMIYSLAKLLFHNKAVGFLAVIFSFFNSSLAFLTYFVVHPLANLEDLKLLIHKTDFIAMGPYNSNIVSAFWHLNIYTNQRHLALALSCALLIFYIFYSWLVQKERMTKLQVTSTGAIVGLLAFWHAQVFIMILLVTGTMALIFFSRKYFWQLLLFYVVALLLAVPQILWLEQAKLLAYFAGKTCELSTCTTPGSSFIDIAVGYLTPKPVTLQHVLTWWFYNIGLTLILLVPALFIQKPKKILFYLCISVLFVVGFVFKFGPDPATNHKYFNLWLIITNMYIAALLVTIFRFHYIGKIVAALAVILLTLSGILEFIPVVNDPKIKLDDWRSHAVSQWIVENTKPDALFLTSNNLYHPVSLAGRMVFMGWPYFAWSSGSDTDGRLKIITDIYTATDKDAACNLLQKNKIDYVVTEENIDDKLSSENKAFFDTHFTQSYQNSKYGITYTIYDVSKSCAFAS